MKKWMSLLLAGILVSAFLVGCKKEDEGSTTTPPATGTGTDGKMEEKKGDDTSTTAPPAEGKMEGGAGDAKMDGGAKMEGGAGTEGAGETKTEEKKEGG